MLLVEDLPQTAVAEDTISGYDGTYEQASATADRFLAILGRSAIAENNEARVALWQSYSDSEDLARAQAVPGELAAEYRNPGFRVPLDAATDVAAVAPVPAVQLAELSGHTQDTGVSRRRPGSLGYWREVGGIGTVVGVISDGTYFKHLLEGRAPRVRRVAAALGRNLRQFAEVEE